AQQAYIQDYLYQFESALLHDDFDTPERSYTDYAELSSFVDFFLINEICRNVDGYRLSTYLYKDRGGKLNMGPIWDLNIGFDTGDRVPWDGWVIHYNQYVGQDAWMVPFWWPRLLEDPLFRQAVKARWTE
ncbi:MAG: CotH kinase family protein, partial [Saprospiraceae bacterium]|nr:CotH kinase family protein [Saprospiraceae bacterium]